MAWRQPDLLLPRLTQYSVHYPYGRITADGAWRRKAHRLRRHNEREGAMPRGRITIASKRGEPREPEYDASRVAAFYDGYGLEEWQRLEATAKGRLMLATQLRFIDQHLPTAARVLDAGCGPGRFAVELARRGARTTLLDISPVQLDIARAKVAEAGVADLVDGYLQGDVCNLADLPDGAFDLTLCIGGALNYVLDRREQAVRELVRVTRPGGRLLVGVMSLWGAVRHGVAGVGSEFVREAEKYALWEVLESGTIPPLDFVRQPPRRLFTAAELCGLLEGAGLRVVDVATTPAIAVGLRSRLEELAADPVAWANLADLEARAGRVSGLLDVGEHLLAAAAPR
jgi:SAM-dependent methyltransferase